ncbi:T9SS type A sorting domain-containing protein [Croceimicrobium sp.]|uniref:T9SS type A sorting domain-containing protein n=1 Tax=Croceimicrobium sp. TaxID=2828340 RepID=UPI003BABC6B2
MKNLLSFLALSLSFGLLAQSELEPTLSESTYTVPSHSSQWRAEDGPEQIIWSEDFSNGIPSSWTQNSSTPNALWEYRGPSTTPSNSMGSRGNFSGVHNVPPSNMPLTSSTGSNGFVIFDSDFLDNAGTSTFGSGAAPSPHWGGLISDTIDLSAYPNVSLIFESYARRFHAEFKIALSTNAGQSFSDTIEIYPLSQIPLNSSTTNGVLTSLNLSTYIGGQDSVQIQFLFNGDTDNSASTDGYYYWMLDDIRIETSSAHSLKIVAAGGNNPQDLIFNPSLPDYPIYGTLHQDQIVPIAGNISVMNDGTASQSNVKLHIEVIEEISGQVVHTMVSPLGCSTLLPGDTCYINNLETGTWTPPNAPARYSLVYKVFSDSLQGSNAYVSADTFHIQVSEDSYSLSSGTISNYVGTNSAVPDMIANGILFSLENEDPDSVGSNNVYIDGVELFLSTTSDPTAVISLEIYDTAGFQFINGFPGGTLPVYSKNFNLSSSMLGQKSFFSFETITPTDTFPLALNTGSYFLVMTYFPSSGGVVRVANDASWEQPGMASVMQLSNGNWFRRFSSSRTFESPHISLRMALNTPYCAPLRDSVYLSNCTGQPITSPSGFNTYYQTGVYLDTIPGTTTCDSIITVFADINSPTNDTLNPLVCDGSYQDPLGNPLTASGTYIYTFSSQAGCDSILTINLTVGNSTAANDTMEVEVCDGNYRSPSGQLYTQSGFYVDTLPNLAGCDSLIPIDLQITHINTTVNTILNGTGLVANQVNAQYQWYDCSNNGFQAMPGDTNQIFTPQQNGQYAVVIQMGTCQDTSDCTLIEDIGLASSKYLDFALFPNPSQGLIHIEGLENENYSLEIHDIQGRKVFEQDIKGADKMEIDLSHLNKGLYQITLKKAHQNGHQILLLD